MNNNPRTYTKKPTYVQALQFTGTIGSADALFQWLAKYGVKCRVTTADTLADGPALIIWRQQGDYIASAGDYIIKGTQNEFYPCSASAFTQLYELVDWEKDRENDLWPEAKHGDLIVGLAKSHRVPEVPSLNELYEKLPHNTRINKIIADGTTYHWVEIYVADRYAVRQVKTNLIDAMQAALVEWESLNKGN